MEHCSLSLRGNSFIVGCNASTSLFDSYKSGCLLRTLPRSDLISMKAVSEAFYTAHCQPYPIIAINNHEAAQTQPLPSPINNHTFVNTMFLKNATFSLFPNLPLELQRKIFANASPRPCSSQHHFQNTDFENSS